MRIAEINSSHFRLLFRLILTTNIKFYTRSLVYVYPSSIRYEFVLMECLTSNKSLQGYYYKILPLPSCILQAGQKVDQRFVCLGAYFSLFLAYIISFCVIAMKYLHWMLCLILRDGQEMDSRVLSSILLGDFIRIPFIFYRKFPLYQVFMQSTQYPSVDFIKKFKTLHLQTIQQRTYMAPKFHLATPKAVKYFQQQSWIQKFTHKNHQPFYIYKHSEKEIR